MIFQFFPIDHVLFDISLEKSAPPLSRLEVRGRGAAPRTDHLGFLLVLPAGELELVELSEDLVGRLALAADLQEEEPDDDEGARRT